MKNKSESANVTSIKQKEDSPTAYEYLTPDNITEVWKLSRQYTEALTVNFWEHERIARNMPHGSIPKELPKTTDGTTASIIRKTPHRILQQLPVGTVKSDKDDWLSIVAQFIYTNKIIPNANEGYALLQKCWNMVERFMTYGFCPIYTPFVEHHGEFTTDMRLPYWGDIFLQPGKLSDADSNYIFMRSWWQTKDIEALIDAQSKLSKGTKRTWDVKALQEVKDFTSTKDTRAQTPVEREKAINSRGGVELITGFQRGANAKFYTFHWPSNTIVRTKTNKDPRGELPILFAYGDIDGTNPLGRGIVELVGGLQNLMDSEMQMYQYNRALQLNPPLIKRGNFSRNKIKFVPNAIIDVGSDPNANVEPLKIDTVALENFPNNYGLMKSQLLNLLASPDTSIGAQIGNPGFSKTPQGVLAGQANLSVDDNYTRKQFERAYERWSETAINIYLAERTGIEELQLDEDTAEALRALDTFDQSLLSQDNKIRINYDSATPALKFSVNASSSQKHDDVQQQQIATNLIDLVSKFPILNKRFGGPIDLDELGRKAVYTSALDDPETVAPEPTTAEKQAKAQAQGKPNGFSPLFDKPKLTIQYPELPPAAQIQLLALAGIQVSEQDVLQGPVFNPNTRGNIEMKGVTDPNMLLPGQEQAPPPPIDPNAQQVTPDHILKAHAQTHSQAMDEAKLQLEQQKAQQQAQQQAQQMQLQAQQQAKQAQQQVKQKGAK